jgi:hypothetical protein
MCLRAGANCISNAPPRILHTFPIMLVYALPTQSAPAFDNVMITPLLPLTDIPTLPFFRLTPGSDH